MLIVEDEEVTGELLVSEFSSAGYETILAVNINEAISKISNMKPHVAIIDVKIHKIDGFNLLKIMKEYSPETEVIMIAKHVTIETVFNAKHNGAYEFIQKPFDINRLLFMVDQAMKKNGLRVLKALHESSNKILSNSKLEDLFLIMIVLIRGVTSSKDVSIFLKNNDGQMYLTTSSIPMFDSQRRMLEKFVSTMFTDESKCYKYLVFDIKNIPKEFERIFDTTGIKTILVYPMVLCNEIVGYLVMTKIAEALSFVQDDLKNISVFIAQIVQSINSTRLCEKFMVKVVELEQALIDLDIAKKEIQFLRKDSNCVFKK
jgi:FixJ family two-component response regulator